MAAVTAGSPLNLVQKWLGHAQVSTTAVYADAVGAEEKDIARWCGDQNRPPKRPAPICN
jgi:integrase